MTLKRDLESSGSVVKPEPTSEPCVRTWDCYWELEDIWKNSEELDQEPSMKTSTFTHLCF